LADRIKAGLELRWTELRATEIVLDEIANEFSGEDPLRSLLRTRLNETKPSVEEMTTLLSSYDRAVRLHEPSEEELTEMRALFEDEGSSPKQKRSDGHYESIVLKSALQHLLRCWRSANRSEGLWENRAMPDEAPILAASVRALLIDGQDYLLLFRSSRRT
jgi:hypothetical protein